MFYGSYFYIQDPISDQVLPLFVVSVRVCLIHNGFFIFFGWYFLCCFEGSTWIFSDNLGLLDSFLKTWFRLTVLGWNCFKITNCDACHLRTVCPVPSWRPGHLPGAWGEGFCGERLRNLGLKAFVRHPLEILGSGLHFPSHPSGIIPSLLPVTVNTPLAFGPGPVGLALPQRVLFFCKGAPPCPFHAGPPKIPQGTRDSTRHPGHRDWGLNPLLPHWVTALTLPGSLWISNTKWGP